MDEKCNVEMYTRFLLSEADRTSCTGLANTMMSGMSHDAVNRFLNRHSFSGYDLFLEDEKLLELVGGHLIADDSVIEKEFSDMKKNSLIRKQYSGRAHGVVRGIGLVTLFYLDIHGVRLPVNFRIYDPELGKTKNELLNQKKILW